MIYLYGNLRKELGESLECNVNSVFEMMKAAEAMIPGFKSHIQKDRKYVIRRGSEFRKAKDVETDEVEMRFKDTDWHIVPMPIGYGGAAKVILGAVLVVVGAVLTAYGYGGVGVPLMKFGAAFMIGGIAELLTRPPDTDYDDRDDANNRASFLFNGPVNRIAAGGAVPLIYGFNVFVGSVFLSGGLEVGDLIPTYPDESILPFTSVPSKEEQQINYDGGYDANDGR